MITLTAKIKLSQDDAGEIEYATSNLGGNNISAYMGSIVNEKQKGSNPFIFGINKLGDGSTYSTQTDYFIGKQFSNNFGQFETPYVIDVFGDVKSIAITFNDVKKEYATDITVNAIVPQTGIVHTENYTNNAITFIVNTIEDVPQHQIIINSWSNPNSLMVVQGIYTEISVELNKKNIISLETKKTTKSTISEPSYGIISSSGSIEFSDLEEQVKEYIRKDLLKENLSCIIYLNNTLTKATKQVDIKYTDTWNYDNDNRVVSVSTKDDLEEWQDISVNGFDFDIRNPFKVLQNGNMSDLYKWLHSRTPEKYQMLTFEELDNKTQQILSSTNISFPYLESGSLWAQWQKLCDACGLYIFKNVGRTVCSYTYGS